MIEAVISFEVVTKGPDATAGSLPSLNRTIGMNDPKNPANVMVLHIAMNMITAI